jgi:hypothetical protein
MNIWNKFTGCVMLVGTLIIAVGRSKEAFDEEA